MFKQEKTKIFTSNHDSTLILIDKSTESSPKTEFLSLASGKGWVVYSEDIPFNIALMDFNKDKIESDWTWEEVSLPEFNGEN